MFVGSWRSTRCIYRIDLRNLPVFVLSDLMPQPVASLLQPMVALPCGVLPRQAPRPWPKDLSLYEEYKLRRNELRRRSINRRRELEKTLPQPLLADLVKLDWVQLGG